MKSDPFLYEWPDGSVRKTVEIKTEQGKFLLPVDLQEGEAEKKRLFRRMSDRMKGWFKGTTTDRSTEETTETGVSYDAGHNPGFSGSLHSFLQQDNTQQTKYKEYDRMYEEQAELRRALTVTVSNCFTSRDGDHESYELVINQSRVKTILEDLEDRVEMQTILPGVCNLALRYGDEYEEPVYNQKGEIVRLKFLNPKAMTRNEDSFGLLIKDAAFTMIQEGQTRGIDFAEWQVIHTRFAHERGNRYGTSFFAPARKYHKYLTVAEDGMLIGLVTRSADQTVYMIPANKNMAQEEAERLIRNVARKMKKRSYVDPNSGKLDWRNHPLADNEDIFLLTNKENPADVRRLGASNVSNQLPVVEYFQNKMFTATGVPKSYLGLERDVNSKATLSWQDIEYARMIRSIQKAMAGFQREVYNLQLVALGIEPTKEMYFVDYPPISFVDEEMRMSIEQVRWNVALQAKGIGMPIGWILEKLLQLPREEVDKLSLEMDAMNAAQPQVAPGTQPWVPVGAGGMESFQNDLRVQRKLQELRDMILFIRKNGLTKKEGF